MPQTHWRKKGAAQLKTREVADRTAVNSVTPLEVMLEAMRTAYANGDLAQAAGLAEKCAPYMYPRLAAADSKVKTAVTVKIVR